MGTNSIGWAMVNEAENGNEKSSIIKIGVRVNPLTTDEKSNFEKGKSITTNADRTLKRSMRRNLQRYKLRRRSLIDILKENNFISDDTVLAEHGAGTTFQTLRLRAKAATEEISLEEFARVMISINKKRGYKSSRKASNEDDGKAIDGMSTAKVLHDRGITPGEYTLELINQNVTNLPEFYQSDLISEFELIWNEQRKFYPDLLTDDLKKQVIGLNERQTWSVCQSYFHIEGIRRDKKGKELLKENYELRVKALGNRLDPEHLVMTLQAINRQISESSSYLGNISDRSKELYFNNQTVGQYMMAKLNSDPNFSLKNMVFYRQDYIDEFETIWKTQSLYHKELTSQLKKAIMERIIFYQRPLKSQKNLIGICEFEQRTIEVASNGKKKNKLIGLRAIPKSSPFFQEFRIWQVLNNLKVNGQSLDLESKEELFNELTLKNKLTKSEILKILGLNTMRNSLNFKEIPGNSTMTAIFKAYADIIAISGHCELDITKMSYKQIMEVTEEIFKSMGWNTGLLHFDSCIEGDAIEKQPLFRLWHLLYSYEGDKSKSGNEKLIEKISELSGMPYGYARIIGRLTFTPDYGNLSAKAIRKILPFMKAGNEYSLACEYAGYSHSKSSLTKEELDRKEYVERLETLPKNSLRNPVVEKILNQMINVVNDIFESYGKPDEIRIELARELKKSNKEREEMSSSIARATAENERIRKILQEEFHIDNISKNDVLRFRLYEELKDNGYKTLYSNTYIPREKLFTKEFDIEHIIPQARLFDDSFSNKTLESRQVNIEKSNMTAFDFVSQKYDVDDYKARVEKLDREGAISKAKYSKLLMTESDIPSDFINRDLRNSQYIARKAREVLESAVRFVVPTIGSITDRLRDDWQLVNVMQELNWDKYNRLGLTYEYKDRDGRTIRKIKDWTKRNDHRHHAMDALTIAFTKRSYIQYLNNLNSRIQIGESMHADMRDFELDALKPEDRSYVIMAIERSELYRDDKGKLRFCPPISLDEFRKEARKHLENVLVSFKAKNKVITKNVNITKKSSGVNKKMQLTPRGKLHNETVYGKIRQYVTKEEKIGGSFDSDKISSVAIKRYREALMRRLWEFGNDPKKAFTGRNSLDKNPIFTDEFHNEQVPLKVMTVSMKDSYTIRKQVDENLKPEKVIDAGIRKILQDRLKEYGNNPKKAFSALDENPIYLNKDKGITIKRVTISGVSTVEPLHDDHDFVSTSNNHHVAIYRDSDGNLQENVVSFYEAVAKATMHEPVIDTEYKRDEGWKFLFTMKQNEYFVFPNEDTGFDPHEIDLTNPENYSIISPNLYRVQKFTNKDYYFRHHLETNVDEKRELKGITWKRIQSINNLSGIVKVRINHLGIITHIGE